VYLDLIKGYRVTIGGTMPLLKNIEGTLQCNSSQITANSHLQSCICASTLSGRTPGGGELANRVMLSASQVSNSANIMRLPQL